MANLSQIRQQLIKLSGRNDLNSLTTISNSDFKHEGDFFIQEASKWLDLNVFIDRTRQHYCIDITSGVSRLLIPDVEVIEKIYAQSSAEQIHEVQLKDYLWIRDNYRKSLSSISNAKPVYCCRGISDLGPNQYDLYAVAAEGHTVYTDQFTYNWGDTVFADESTPGSVGRYRTSSLIFVPPPEKTYTISVIGKFYSKLLYEDTDENIWSARYSGLLLKASIYQIESWYRNSEGSNDLRRFIEDDRTGLHFKQTEQESYGINRFKG